MSVTAKIANRGANQPFGNVLAPLGNVFDTRKRVKIPKEEQMLEKEEVISGLWKEINEEKARMGKKGSFDDFMLWTEESSYIYTVVLSKGRQGRAFAAQPFLLMLLLHEYDLARAYLEKKPWATEMTEAYDFLYDFDREEWERFCVIRTVDILTLLCNDPEIPEDIMKKIIGNINDHLGVVKELPDVFGKQIFDDRLPDEVKSLFPTKISFQYTGREPKEEKRRAERSIKCMDKIFDCDPRFIVLHMPTNSEIPPVDEYGNRYCSSQLLGFLREHFYYLPKLVSYYEREIISGVCISNWLTILELLLYEPPVDMYGVIPPRYLQKTVIRKGFETVKELAPFFLPEEGEEEDKHLYEQCILASYMGDEHSYEQCRIASYMVFLIRYLEKVIKSRKKDKVPVTEVFDFATEIVSNLNEGERIAQSVLSRLFAGGCSETVYKIYRKIFGKIEVEIDEQWLGKIRYLLSRSINMQDSAEGEKIFSLLKHVERFSHADGLKKGRKNKRDWLFICAVLCMYESEELLREAVKKEFMNARDIKAVIRKYVISSGDEQSDLRRGRWDKNLPYMFYVVSQKKEGTGNEK